MADITKCTLFIEIRGLFRMFLYRCNRKIDILFKLNLIVKQFATPLFLLVKWLVVMILFCINLGGGFLFI